jgi:selenoprotein W-related protein
LLTTYKQKIGQFTLVPKGGGCFELSVNGSPVFSKLKEGRFPDEEWAVTAVGKFTK